MSDKEHAHASRRGDEDDDRKRPAPDTSGVLAEDYQDGAVPELPDLNTGPVEPAAWLALQQTLGNRAVGGLVEQCRSGQPIPPKTRHDMEASFGRDFGQVQVHSGPEVDQATQALGAPAFTVADDIYIHSDLAGLDRPLGREVLGEELAHVAQGVGTHGIARITDPSESAEKEARAAGRAATSGERSEVRAAPEAASAVARYSPSEDDDLFKNAKRVWGGNWGGDEADKAEGKQLGGIAKVASEVAAGFIASGGLGAAKAAEPTELKDEEKDRLAEGALRPLNALLNQLIDKRTGPMGGTKQAKTLQPQVDNARGISSFIASFTGPAAIQPTIKSAAISAAAGLNALLVAINPAQVSKDLVVSDTAYLAADIDALSVAPKLATTPGPTPAPEAQADSLTPAEAEQLKYGAAKPLASASEQLGGDQPDLDAIIARLSSVPGVLRSFSKPAALVPLLHQKAARVEVSVRFLEVIRSGPEKAIDTAIHEWRACIDLLQGLTAKSPTGASPAMSETPASGDDDDKNKPK